MFEEKRRSKADAGSDLAGKATESLIRGEGMPDGYVNLERKSRSEYNVIAGFYSVNRPGGRTSSPISSLSPNSFRARSPNSVSLFTTSG